MDWIILFIAVVLFAVGMQMFSAAIRLHNAIGEFCVHGVTETGVVGRCFNGPLRVGDEFTSASGITISLKITRIEIYQRNVNEIEAGMAAFIELSGHGLEFIVDHAVLKIG